MQIQPTFTAPCKPSSYPRVLCTVCLDGGWTLLDALEVPSLLLSEERPVSGPRLSFARVPQPIFCILRISLASLSSPYVQRHADAEALICGQLIGLRTLDFGNLRSLVP